MHEMKHSTNRHIALLRGINVGGKNLIPMDELRELCQTLGWSNLQTYIQSGNIVFTAGGTGDELEAALEGAIQERFNLAVPVIVRSSMQWQKLAKTSAFPEAIAKEPQLVLLALSKQKPSAAAASALQERAKDGERLHQEGDALWIHFPNGSGRSKLTPALLDRHFGSPVTTRNFRTVQKLAEMSLAGGESSDEIVVV